MCHRLKYKNNNESNVKLRMYYWNDYKINKYIIY